MPLQISALRRWFALAVIFVVVVVAGAYLYAKWRIENALKQVPEKIGLEVQQSAQGFTISKSEGGHTIFKLEASKAIQYKQGDHASLHDVNITLYGPDSKRFDQIYGSDFEYDMRSGDITAKGEVQIDLEANPAGIKHPDQAVPEELKNPIHVRTSGLVFNRKSGDAYTNEKVEFSMPQVRGSATGAAYDSKTNILTLRSNIQAEVEGANPATISADRAVIAKAPRVVSFQQARGQSSSQQFEADDLRLHLRADNTVEQAVASGHVHVQSRTNPPAEVRAGRLEVLLNPKMSTLKNAVFSEDVRWQTAGSQAMTGRTDRATLDFRGKNLLTRVHLEGGVKMEQLPPQPRAQTSQADKQPAQHISVAARAAEFFVGAGKHLQRAETLGPATITIDGENPGQPEAKSQTAVSADHFDARFDPQGGLAALRGSPQARIVNTAPGRPERTSSSDMVEVAFSNRQVESIMQQGNVAYDDGSAKAWGGRARYTVADQLLVLTGSPRVVDGGGTTTADALQLNRATGNALAEGSIKTTFTDLKPQPDGALLASSDPVHVTAKTMTSDRAAGIVHYSGGCRLWQGANIIQAPTIDFDRKRRSVVAAGSADLPVSTVLLQPAKTGAKAPAAKNAPTPVTITATRLTYVDSERQVHFAGDIVAKSGDATITASQADVFLLSQGQAAGTEPVAGMGKVDRIIAEGNVVLTEPNRRATGDQLVYTAASDQFVLSGGPPSIFDAERGKITGVSLTFFRRDDRVLVDGNTLNPAVTQIRVAR